MTKPKYDVAKATQILRESKERIDAELAAAEATAMTCPACGAKPGDSYTDSSGHFLVNDDPCPRAHVAIGSLAVKQKVTA